MKILLTNDDGIDARGLSALADEISRIAEVFVAAPDRERSATGHSITVFDPIRVVKTVMPGVKAAWIIGGTPVDCVKLALARLIEEPIDLVVSGINHGSNMGTDVLYSGTVSAAAEGVIMGTSALAVSLDTSDPALDFSYAAAFIRQTIEKITRQGIDAKTMLNINIPRLAPEEIKGVKITKLGIRNYDNLFEERTDPRGNTYYWLGGDVVKEEQEPDSDVFAVQNGYISITPIHLDLTDYRLISQYQSLFAP